MAYGPTIEQALLRNYEPDTVFRVEAVSYAQSDEYGDFVRSSAPKLEVTAFDVRKWTECGATLNVYSGGRPKWVDLRTGHKQWASRTIEEAVRQFGERRRRQIYVLQRQLARAQYEHDLANSACKGIFDDLGLLPSATETPT